jgi:antitoxin HigA-1
MTKELPPVHPVEMPSYESTVPFGFSSTSLASPIGIAPARMAQNTREKRGITADTALRLARCFGTDAQNRMHLQGHYELERVRLKIGIG